MKITTRAAGAVHPYHAVSFDGSGVYGKVDADKLTGDQINYKITGIRNVTENKLSKAQEQLVSLGFEVTVEKV